MSTERWLVPSLFSIKFMFEITSPYLEKINGNYASQFEVAIPDTYSAILTTIDYREEVSVVLVSTYGQELSVPNNIQTVTAVLANGVPLTPATNPQSPRPGEYIYSPYTAKITTYTDAASIVVLGNLPQIPVLSPVTSGLPSLFSLLPINGDIQVSRSLENHPSASFGFETHYTKDQIHQIFTPGREVEMLGMGFRVSDVNCKELPISIYPEGRVSVSISFTGKWENYLGKPCFLRKDGANTIPSDAPFTDSECLNGLPEDPNSQVSLPTLFQRIGIPLTGKQLKSVPIPRGTARDAVVNPDQLLSDRLLIANSFVRYSDANSVEVVDIDGLATHFIAESEILGEIESSYQGIQESNKEPLTPSSLNPLAPDLVNFPAYVTRRSPIITAEAPTALAVEYPLVELQGQFLEPKENTGERSQGQKPRYTRRPIRRKTKIEGDEDAHLPPDGVFSVQVMSLCFDLGGEQRTRTFITTENDTTIETTEETWGFVFTAEDIYNVSTGQYGGDPANFWRCLRQVTTQWIYDETLSGEGGTGYLLYKIGQGFDTVRWKQESADKPETLKIAGQVSASATATRELYTFFQIPVIERHSRRLKLMPEYSDNGLFELYKRCNRDGTASYEPIINPDYAPPYYIEWERTEKISFARRANPANNGKTASATTKLLPNFYAGSLFIGESRITDITPAEYERTLIGFQNGYPVYQRGEMISPQKWARFNYKFSATGQNIATATEEAFTETGTGDPPVAEPRRQPRYKREEPTAPDGDTTGDEPEYKYLIWTDGYSIDDPISGSESFSIAETFDEAMTAAKCKIAIENWRNGYQESLKTVYKPQIKEGDLITYLCKGQYRTRIVLGVSHAIQVAGQAITSLSLGKYVKPNVNSTKVKLPSTKSDGRTATIVVDVVNQNLGSLLDWANIKSRRNP